jgi:hypothetical protein
MDAVRQRLRHDGRGVTAAAGSADATRHRHEPL